MFLTVTDGNDSRSLSASWYRFYVLRWFLHRSNVVMIKFYSNVWMIRIYYRLKTCGWFMSIFIGMNHIQILKWIWLGNGQAKSSDDWLSELFNVYIHLCTARVLLSNHISIHFEPIVQYCQYNFSFSLLRIVSATWTEFAVTSSRQLS